MSPVVIGEATLYLGDCLEILPALGEVHALVSDPPYGLGKLLDRGNDPDATHQWARHYAEGPPTWDGATCEEGIQAALKRTTQAIIWGGQFYSLPVGRCWLIWNKIVRNWSSSECELAWTNLECPNRAFDYSHGQLATEGKHFHPTQKPVPLMEWCIDKTTGRVLDPFMGSGSTGVGCINLGRPFVGIEIDRGYFDSACQRIDYAQRQGRLFA